MGSGVDLASGLQFAGPSSFIRQIIFILTTEGIFTNGEKKKPAYLFSD